MTITLVVSSSLFFSNKDGAREKKWCEYGMKNPKAVEKMSQSNCMKEMKLDT